MSSGDYIDRQQAIRNLEIYTDRFEAIKACDSAEVREIRVGHIVVGGGCGDTHWAECSECLSVIDIADKWCPKCGARLKGVVSG